MGQVKRIEQELSAAMEDAWAYEFGRHPEIAVLAAMMLDDKPGYWVSVDDDNELFVPNASLPAELQVWWADLAGAPPHEGSDHYLCGADDE